MNKRQVVKILYILVSTLTFLVVALLYFGLDPNVTLPERCAVGPPLRCSESAVTEDGVSMFLSNTDSRIMSIKKIAVLSDALDDCSWSSAGPSYPTLENRNPHIIYTLSSNNTFIPTSAIGSGRTNNFNGNAASNDSLDGCAFNPKNSRADNQYEFTITYNWKDSPLTHSVSGRFFAEKPIHSWKRDPRDFLDDLIRNLDLFFILYLLSGFLAVGYLVFRRKS